ncbi:MAG: cytochrome b/b6 domain-containing protein [Candidatus Riflebacteria bacterium]|nr:cytochrome b/b6 domain-containing protein [Candidatus Riflebacteria bacterium]
MKNARSAWHLILSTVIALTAGCGLATAEETPQSSPTACLECHDTWKPERLSSFESSIHGKVGCTGCHEGMKEYPHTGDAKSAFDACARCHGQASESFAKSIHALKAGKTAAAFAKQCLACHGDAHAIAKLPANQPDETACLRCHGDQESSRRLGLSPAVFRTYQDSVHGQKRNLGSKKSPGCVDCHSAHQVRSSDDPKSQIHVANRARTCSLCHLEATQSFALTFSHRPVTWESRPVAYAVSLLYGIAIAATILFFITLISLELASFAVRKLLGKPLPLHDEGHEERFTAVQRLQHALIMTTFILLVLTGIPLLASDTDREAGLIRVMGGVETAANIHRIAGFVMILTTLWHVAWLLRLKADGRLRATMLPSPAEIVELIHQIQNYFLLRDAPPARTGKYGWMEKFEYWAFGWGLTVMGVTGFVLWFPVLASSYLPPDAFIVIQLIHGYEAILATVSIFIWHFYQVHLKPGTFPMNWTWLTGRHR